MTKTVFSGVQPTGDLHLGNYLGAIKGFADLQTDHTAYFCVVDLHSLTVKHDNRNLWCHSLEITAAYMASGISEKSAIFLQSSVSQHAEMNWILSCVARMGWMERMHQFQDKTGDNKERASVGLFTYPILMAADILTYGADIVPVGDDQKQHLELAQMIATRFNNEFGDTFCIPAAHLSNAPRIMSLQDGSSKMSKSDPDDKSRINLRDTNDEIARKIKRAVTDTVPFNPEVTKPEIVNLMTIHGAITGLSRDDITAQWDGLGYGVIKNQLTEAIVEEVSPIRDRMNDLLGDPDEIKRVLRNGRDRAIVRAEETRDRVYGRLGILSL